MNNHTGQGVARDVSITTEALKLINRVEEEHGSVDIILDDGCCEGMGPVLIERDRVNKNAELLGVVENVAVLAPAGKSEFHEKFEIEIDLKETIGAGGFSLEIPYGYKLLSKEQVPNK